MTAQPVDLEPPADAPSAQVGRDLADLAATVAALSETVLLALDDDDTTEAVVQLLADLHAHRTELQRLEAFVNAAAAKRLRRNGKQTVAGIKLHVGSSRVAWKNDDLAKDACRDLYVDKATGEIDPEARQIVDLVRSRLLLCARPDWRLTALREIGIDPADYHEWGRRTVSILADDPEPESAAVSS